METINDQSRRASAHHFASTQVARAVILFGLDGSGKTTLARTILDHFNLLGITVKYARPKFGERIWLRSNENATPHSGIGLESGKNPALSIVDVMLLIALLVEHFAAITLKMWIPVVTRRCVIAERAWPDTLVDAVVDFNVPYEIAAPMLRPIMMTKKETLILLSISSNAAFERKPGPYDIGYLEKRESVYDRITLDFGAIRVNTDQSIEATVKEFMDAIHFRSGEDHAI